MIQQRDTPTEGRSELDGEEKALRDAEIASQAGISETQESPEPSEYNQEDQPRVGGVDGATRSCGNSNRPGVSMKTQGTTNKKMRTGQQALLAAIATITIIWQILKQNMTPEQPKERRSN